MSKGKNSKTKTWDKTEMLISRIEAQVAASPSKRGENGAYKCCGYHDCICPMFPNAGGQEVPVPIRPPLNIKV